MTFHAKPTPKGALWKQMPQYAAKDIKTPKKHIHGSKKTIPARKPVRRVSKTRQKERCDYRKRKDAYMIRQPFCQVCFKEKAIDVHHVRGTFKARLNDEKWWMSVCRKCHDFIHAHPSWSYARGYLVTRSGQEPTVNPHVEESL